ncbi:MAG: acetylxylan esterase [Bryobacteraceae bacterium]|nr:acetylxylan esterase [Bryobacteraceae bacterium]
MSILRVTRRDVLRVSLGAAGIAGASLRAQQDYPGIAYREYARCLPDYLRSVAEKAYQYRNNLIAGLTAGEAVRERQRWTRETFWRLVGGMPERTPLNARTAGSFERPGYKLEKVIYESRPGLFVTANLYIPTAAKPPFPGVVFQLGHAVNGKSSSLYQKCCQGLARLGYLVLAFDPMGQGERAYYLKPGSSLSRLDSADDEHTYPGRQMLLLGDTSTRFQTWDAVRSLDYLASHPLVDPTRLASTGNSGGGTLTMMLAAVDDRLAAAVASCPNTENLACANFNPPGSTDDAEQNFVDAGPRGFARWDLFYPFAPKPLLVLVSARDFFGTYSPNYIANGWEEFQKLRRVYEVLGRAEDVAWQDTPLPHGLDYNMRLRIYNWFARWLQRSNEPVKEEPPVNVEADETLWCTETGSVVRSLKSETPFTLTRAAAARIRTPDKAPPLAALVRADLPPADLTARIMGRAPSARADVEAIEVPSAERVWLPAWLFTSRKPDASKPAVLALEPSGRVNNWREDDLYPALAAEGFTVCLPDLRGLGDLRPEFPRGAPGHGRFHQEEEAYAWASMMLGKPLLGQRVTDILALAQALRAHPAVKGRRLVLAARGTVSVPALFAAAIDPGIESAYLSGGLVSYRSLVETESYAHPFANFLPGVLLQTDLPQVAASAAPRSFVIAGAVDGSNKPLTEEAVRRAYERAPNVRVQPAAAWDLAALRQLR